MRRGSIVEGIKSGMESFMRMRGFESQLKSTGLQQEQMEMAGRMREMQMRDYETPEQRRGYAREAEERQATRGREAEERRYQSAEEIARIRASKQTGVEGEIQMPSAVDQDRFDKRLAAIAYEMSDEDTQIFISEDVRRELLYEYITTGLLPGPARMRGALMCGHVSGKIGTSKEYDWVSRLAATLQAPTPERREGMPESVVSLTEDVGAERQKGVSTLLQNMMEDVRAAGERGMTEEQIGSDVIEKYFEQAKEAGYYGEEDKIKAIADFISKWAQKAEQELGKHPELKPFHR